MTLLFEPRLPLLHVSECEAAWNRVYRELPTGETPEEYEDTDLILNDLAERLAVALIGDEQLREQIQRACVYFIDGPGASGNEVPSPLEALHRRVRITPLQLIVEGDADAARRVVRYPCEIGPLLLNQDLADKDDSGLTPRIRVDTDTFHRRMKLVGPLMLERIGDLDDWDSNLRRSSEPFLWYLRLPRIELRLQQATHVRDELGPVLADFMTEHDLTNADAAEAYFTRSVMDNILWQVAAILTRRDTYDESEKTALNMIAARLKSEIRTSGREPSSFVRFVLSDFEREWGPPATDQLLNRLKLNYELLC